MKRLIYIMLLLIPVLGFGQLKGYWKFNNDTIDYSGNGNTGTRAGGLGFVVGYFGQALNVTAGTTYVSIASSSSYKPTGSITLAAWVRITTIQNAQKIICLPYRTTGWSAPYVSYCLNTDEGNNKKATMGICKSGTLTAYSGSTTLQTGVWYFIVGTYDGSYVRIYVNGNLDHAAYSLTGNIDYGTSGPLYIGGDGPQRTTGEYMIGKIDEVRIESTAWSPAKVKTMYAAYKGLL